MLSDLIIKICLFITYNVGREVATVKAKYKDQKCISKNVIIISMFMKNLCCLLFIWATFVGHISTVSFVQHVYNRIIIIINIIIIIIILIVQFIQKTFTKFISKSHQFLFKKSYTISEHRLYV